jgi:ABC-2 type transport system permease protein
VRQILAIFRREQRAAFTSTMVPVVVTGFLVLTGLFWYLFVLAYSEMSAATLASGRLAFLDLHAGVFHRLYGLVVIFFIFLLPAITMRLLSSEYRSGRYELLASWPVTDRRWILGKWLSALAVVAVLLAGAVFYFGLTWVLGGLGEHTVRPDWQPLLTSLLGLMLLAGAVTAWGLAASALFEHQAAAYFVGFAVAMALSLLSELEPLLPGLLGQAAAQLALRDHFLRFAGGVIDLRDVVYYLGLAAVGLAVAEAALAQRRLQAARRGGPWAAVLMVLAVAVFLQAVAARRPLSVDLTPTRLYSLAPQTERILDSLDRPRSGPDGQTLPPAEVEALAFYHNLDGARENIQARLRAFGDRDRHLAWRVLDPNHEPELVREHGVSQARTVVLLCEGRRRLLLDPDEAQLAGALYRIATDTRPVVYWLQGHGEARPDLEEGGGASVLAGLLIDAGYDLRPLNLPERLHLPEDAAAVIWPGPKFDPAPEVLDLLGDYLRQGGGMAAFFGPGTPPAVRRWTEAFNVRQRDDVVIAPNRAGAYAGVGLRTVVTVDGYTSHPAVRSLKGNATTFPLVQTLASVGEDPPGIRREMLILTPPDTWAETDPATRYSGLPSFDPASDRRGPQLFAAAVRFAPAGEEPGGPRDGRLVLLGSSGFVTNGNILQYANRDLALNIVGWLAAEEDLLGIRGRRASFQPLVLPEGARNWLGVVAVLAWPGLVGAAWIAWLMIPGLPGGRRRTRKGEA